MITVCSYFSAYEAAMDKSFLESCDISAYLADDCGASIGLGSIVGPLRLQVEECDAEEANVLLAHRRDAPLPDDFVPPPEAVEPGPTSRSAVSWWWVILLLGGTFAALLILSPPSTQHRHHRPMRSTLDPWAPFTR